MPISGGGSSFAWDSTVVIALLVVGVVMMCAFFVCEWKIASLPILPCKSEHIIGHSHGFAANSQQYISSAYRPCRLCLRKAFSLVPYTTGIYSTFRCFFNTSWGTRLSRLELSPSPIRCHNRFTASYLDSSFRRQIGTRESSYSDLPSGLWELVSRLCGRQNHPLDR